MKGMVWTVALLLAFGGWASAEQVIIDLTVAPSMATSIYRDNLQANTGVESPPVQYIGGPGSKWGVAYALYYFDVSALAGTTIDNAVFTFNETWWSCPIPNTEVRRLITPYLWEAGSGTKDDRWGAADNGVGGCMVDWNTATGQGHDWGGTLRTYLSWGWDNVESAMGAEVFDSHTLENGTSNAWTITSLVQNWVDGTWENKGFILFPGASANADQLANPTMTIDYTIPEPASILFISTAAAGLLGLARRRRMK